MLIFYAQKFLPVPIDEVGCGKSDFLVFVASMTSRDFAETHLFAAISKKSNLICFKSFKDVTAFVL